MRKMLAALCFVGALALCWWADAQFVGPYMTFCALVSTGFFLAFTSKVSP
jgi:hypothetical protein